MTGLSLLTAEIALISYTLLILIRNGVAGLDGVEPEIVEAATGLGHSRRQRLAGGAPARHPGDHGRHPGRDRDHHRPGGGDRAHRPGRPGVRDHHPGIRRAFETAIVVGVMLSVLLAVLPTAGSCSSSAP